MIGFDYEVIRNQRRKRISICFCGDGKIVVRAPVSSSMKEIERFLLLHRERALAWIERCKTERADRVLQGEAILFGVRYPIVTGRPSVASGVLSLPERGKTQAFYRLVAELSQRTLSRTVAEIAEKYGFRYRNVRIMRNKRRWGYCRSDGEIGLHLFLAFLESEVCEYVVVHELCHTRQPNHSAAFWKEVEGVLPDYKQRRKKLKEHSISFYEYDELPPSP